MLLKQCLDCVHIDNQNQLKQMLLKQYLDSIHITNQNQLLKIKINEMKHKRRYLILLYNLLLNVTKIISRLCTHCQSKPIKTNVSKTISRLCTH